MIYMVGELLARDRLVWGASFQFASSKRYSLSQPLVERDVVEAREGHGDTLRALGVMEAIGLNSRPRNVNFASRTASIYRIPHYIFFES